MSETGPQVAPSPLDQALTAVRQLTQAVRGRLAPDQRRHADSILTGLDGPVRVKVVGRVSTGKSTLINALVGRRIAATAAQDCTTVATSYSYGAPDRTVAVLADGTERQTGFGFDDRDALVADDVRHLRVLLASGLLRHFTLIDTPGLMPTSAQRPLSDGTDLDADVLVYVFRGALRTDDAEVVEEFRSATGGQLPLSAACIGLLSHADNFGAGPWGEHDPLQQAQRAAERLQQALPGRFSAILPVCGLLAETVRIGALTESDARALHSVRELDPMQLEYLDQLPPPEGIDADAVRRVRALVGGYGLRHGAEHSHSAASLLSWMLERSGLPAVERHLGRELLPVVQRGRAERALTQLTQLSGRHDIDSRIQAMIEDLVAGPEFQPLREYRAYRSLLQQCPDSPLIAELAAMMATPGDHEPLSAAELVRLASQYQGRVVLARRGAEAEAARTMSTSLLHRAQRVGRPPTGPDHNRIDKGRRR